MPLYCYINEDGVTREIEAKAGEAPKSVTIEGKEGWRDFRAEMPGVPATSGWPMPPCVASGVHPEQAGQLREHLRRSGVPTEVTKDGDPIYRDARHRRRALKARGMVDRAGY